MANFGQFLTKMVKTGIFQKSVWNILSRLQALINCKVSEKSNEWFPRKSVTDGRTYGRTDTTPKVSMTSWSRDQKVMSGFREKALRCVWSRDQKWSQYGFKQPKCIVLGTSKKPEKGQERTYPRQN